jgi:hypothetical protein
MVPFSYLWETLSYVYRYEWDTPAVFSWPPFCCGRPGLMRSIGMPSLNHQTESLERLNKLFGVAHGTPFIGSDRLWQTAFPEQPFEGRNIMSGHARPLD